MDGAGALMPSWLELWNEWEIQVVVVASFSLQVILFFLAGIRRYNVSFVLKVLLWLVYLLAGLAATYALGHMSSTLSKKSSGEHQLVAFWAPFLLLHLGGQDTITAYSLEDNELWLRHLLNMFLQVAGTGYVLYKYIKAGRANFVPAAMLILAAGFFKYSERIWALKCASKGSKGPGNSVLLFAKKKEENSCWFGPVLFAIKKKTSPICSAINRKTGYVLYAIDRKTGYVLSAIYRKAGYVRCDIKEKINSVLFAIYRKTGYVRHVIKEKINSVLFAIKMHPSCPSDIEHSKIDCFTKNKQFGIYAFIVMTAHALRHALVKPLVIDRNEASIDWSGTTIGLLSVHVQEYPFEDGEGQHIWPGKRYTKAVYKAIEVELGLMYDMLYTKAEVIHTWYGYCIRAISLVSSLAALVFFTKSKRDDYSTPDVVITFVLLGGACGLEVASVFKVIGSTWTCATLKGYGWKWLANAILFARYHLVVVKDGRWSNFVGQYNIISFCARDETKLREAIAKLIGLQDLWNKAHYTKHSKLSPAVKEFIWDLLKGEKNHMVEIEEVDIWSGNWARRFSGFDQCEQLDWSLSFEFQKSVLIWHIATSTFLNSPAVKSQLVDKDDKDMAKSVNTLSDYMMYLLIEHPDILPVKAAARDLLCKTCTSYAEDFSGDNVNGPHQIILDYKKRRLGDIRKLYGDLTQYRWDAYQGEAVLVKACSLAHTMVDMKLGLTHKMVIIGRVWTEMLCYAAINASGGFHARQLSNGGEFLTHILLLTKYCAAMPKIANPYIRAADRTVEGSAGGHVELAVDYDCNDEITKILPLTKYGSDEITKILPLTKYGSDMPKIAKPYFKAADETVESSAAHCELIADSPCEITIDEYSTNNMQSFSPQIQHL